MPKSVLFICLGNICRSPIAEALFRHYVKEQGLEKEWIIDGAALGDWHVGNLADRNALKVLRKHGLDSDHKVRVLTKEDFNKFDVIFGMDDENMETLKSRKPANSKAKLELLGTYDPEGFRIIDDPYYGTYDDFETVYEQCARCTKAFLEKNSSSLPSQTIVKK